ncbi:hypothetical protein TPHA_0C01560 [Tetrapisispora phaffii CBS 4417]|uniref:RNA helicase n=1 Tax=Tetrapisispora phaffii (strain ATCC 24235 / CBS 4417 / NBRC 1672 / NRRL Y-8282 / UCD 70-5) TaxID=1071381 RepID=G8BRD6_TETPH|nr:hypothetical protein TPHA_0C01560 [Tetrapisispora phaffii CBS 4417]CCE62312.1 hypothetical protein TPHA_0C01560 [Tetrapisispora phaffii CBS 4417]
MSMQKENIIKILGTDDDTVINFIKNINGNSETLEEFQKKIKNLDVGLSLENINKLYNLLNEVHSIPVENNDRTQQSLVNYTDSGKQTTINDRINDILQREIGINDIYVTNFILDIMNTSKDYESFEKKMNDLDVGISTQNIKSLFKLKEPKSNTIENNITHIKWGDLSKNKNTVSEVKFNPFLSKKQQPQDIKVNGILKGRVRKITSFGCFINIKTSQSENKDGLLHISEMSNEKIGTPNDLVKTGDMVWVKIITIHENGKISLSMKNIDQQSGKEIINEANIGQDERGRSKEHKKENIRRRKLTSPERWEIQQLIASGAASIDDYPELKLETKVQVDKHYRQKDVTSVQNPDKQVNSQVDEDEPVEIELNHNWKPAFLKNETKNISKKFEMPKINNVPKGSMRRIAMGESQLMREHRDQKFKKKALEQELRSYINMDDPNKDPEEIRRKIKDLKEKMVLTEWERNRMGKKIRYGKRSSKPISVQRQSLPVFKMRSELIHAIRNNQFLVIVGETGSGKTTQITQYLNEDGFADHGIIGCTQPRRVAAVSVATRVAEEYGCRLGDEVGYTIRFEDVSSPKTKIKYMTDGILQIEALTDPLMSKYSVILLDEAHERTVATDVLFALLKDAVKKRPDLKVVITSATLDSMKFSEYFDNCPVITIPGKTFPVEVLYYDAPNMDYIESSLDTVMQIHINEGPGDILVFLTGQEEIDTCCEILYSRVKELGDAIGDLIILPIYSALPSELQSKIFESTPKGSRKVVFATNIAETSITIDGIYYVIDPGFSKINIYNPKVGIEQLVVSPISQAQANQRKGRAGRTGPGKCYRLYTESAFYHEMSSTTTPEIQRQNLSHTILMLKSMGIENLLEFDFMDPPPKHILISALEELYHLQALDTEGKLTSLGHRMSQFPMEPALSRTLLSSVKNGCSDDIITIISMLSVQNVFYRPKEKQQEADQKKAKFFHPYGDHLTLLNVFIRWKQANYNENFCTMNFLHYRHLNKAKDIKQQITLIFKKLNLTMTVCYGDPDLIRKTLVSGYFMNAAKRDSQVGYTTVVGNTSVAIHPSSSLYGKDYDYVIYNSLVLTSREYMSQVTSIEPQWLLECAPHFYKKINQNSMSRKKIKIEPLYDRYSKDQDSWRLSSIRQSREKALGIKR